MTSVGAQAVASSVLPDEDDDDYEMALADAEPVPEVSSLIAVIRIIAVLGMGLCLAFGLFLMLIGGSAIIVGAVLMLLAVPCYFGMQFAEKWAAGGDPAAASDG